MIQYEDGQDLADVLENGDDEHYQVARIKQYLRTPEQKKILDEHDWSIENILNGRIEGDMSLINVMLQDWNKKLEREIFYIYD